MATENDLEVKVAIIDERTKNMDKTLVEIKTALEKNYPTRAEFDPIKSAVYGIIGLIVIGVIGAVIKLVIK